jgi:succinate dehydrogenase / fumarate reductase cytochrome b subunit
MPDAMVKKKRPLWYNLNLLNLPIPAVVSILHRISGALLFVLTFALLYYLDASLASPERFDFVRHVLGHPLSKLVILVLLWAFLHHLLAGVRYLLLDLGMGLQLPNARASSYAVIGASLALTVVLGGVLLW